nr:aminoacyl-tRNA synthetase, class 1a, anticodon-binding [Tanacetum cinerariifolium]
VSWQCKKQTIVATSSTEAEYVAAASCCDTRIEGRTKPKGRLTIVYFAPPMLLVVPVFLLVVLVHADGWVPTGSCTIPTGSYSFMLMDGFLLVVALFLLVVTRSCCWIGPSKIIATIAGNEVVVTESLIRTQLQLNDANGLYEFTLHDVLDGMREIGTYNFSRFILDGMIGNDGPHMPLLAPMLVVPAGGDGADAVAAATAAANDVPPPPPPPVTAPPDPTTFREPTPDPPRPPSPPLRPVEPWPTSSTTPFHTTTSIRPPSPTRHTSFQEDISEGGGDYVSLPKSNEAPPTTAATAGGGAEDSAALTDLSLKLDKCINRVTTLENELGVTKKVLGGAVLKLVSRVKRLEGLLQQRKRRMVLSDSEGEEAAAKEKDIDLDALHKMTSTSLGGDTTVEAIYTIYKASQDAHASSDAGHDDDAVPEDTTMPFKRTRFKRRRLRKTFTSLAFEHFHDNISAVKDTIPAGDGIPADAQTIPAGSTPIPTTGGISAGSSMDPAGQAAAATPSSTIPTVDKGLSAQCRRELDAAQRIYTEANWLELMAKIATNSALSKQLLGDDVNEENMNERLGMLLMRKRRELAEQSRVKPMNKTQQRDFMRDFVKNQSASVYNQGWTMKQVKALSLAQLKHEFEYIQRTLKRSNLLNFKRTTFRPTPTLEAPSAKRARQRVPLDVHAASLQVHATDSHPDDNHTASEQVSAEHTIDDSSESDDEPTPYAPYAGWEMVPTPLGFNHAYYDMEEHTKHFTSLRELLHMVEKNDLRKLLGDSLTDEDAHAFWRNQESWRISSWLLYPRPHVHVLETVDGRVIYMFVNVFYPLSEATMERMLKHGLEVPKLLVGGDLTMAEQLVSFIKAALLNAQFAV